MRIFHRLLVLLSLGITQIPWIKRILRYLASRMVAGLLRLRSRQYPPEEDRVMMVIAPHQDDCTLGCGGLVLCQRLRGQSIHVVYVTDGSGSHPGHPTVPPQELAMLRKQEGLVALRLLGVETPAIHFVGAQDGTLSHLSPDQRSDIISRLRHLLLIVRPDEVLIPFRRDGSSEHEAAFGLFSDALSGIEARPRIFEYLVWSWWNPLRLLPPLISARRVWCFRFCGYEGIKIAALKCYRSQFEPTPPWHEPVLSADFVRLFHRPYEFYLEL